MLGARWSWLFAVALGTVSFAAAAAPAAEDPPSPEQIQKRLERVKRLVDERRQNLAQRKKDRRRAVRKRLERLLAGDPIEPAVKEELATHARRVASLRQIRYVAAVQNDFDTVVAVDGLLARENTRHERWWREQAKAKRRVPDAGAHPEP
jgi:hypothetical protein